jgi:hypothetical protein
MLIPLLLWLASRSIAAFARAFLLFSSFNAILVSVTSSLFSIVFETLTRTIGIAGRGSSLARRDVIISCS